MIEICENFAKFPLKIITTLDEATSWILENCMAFKFEGPQYSFGTIPDYGIHGNHVIFSGTYFVVGMNE